MHVATEIIVWLNQLANAAGRFLLSPLAVLPAWLSLAIAAALSGVMMLVIFKYTSNQRAVRAVRNRMKADLLALKLFKESPRVMLRSQARILKGAFVSFLLALVPMLVMTAPVVMLLAQLSLWYQWRPLEVGEEALVSLKLRVDEPSWPIQKKEDDLVTWDWDAYELQWPDVVLEPNTAIEVTLGPTRVVTKREIFWNVRATEPGHLQIVFNVDGQPVEKQLVVADSSQRVSLLRPSWKWSDALLHPAERPFHADSMTQAIEIRYPERTGWLTGADAWVVYWFVVSMLAAFVFRPLFNVTF